MNKKELLLLSVGIFLTVVAWLIADIYYAATREKIKSTVEIPNLQKSAINKEILQTLQGKNE